MQLSKSTEQQYKRNHAIQFKHFVSFTSKCRRIHSVAKQKSKIKTKSITQGKKVNLRQNNISKCTKSDKFGQIIYKNTQSFDQQKAFLKQETKNNNNGYQQLFTEDLRQTNKHSQDIQGEDQMQNLLMIPINHQIVKNRKILKNIRSKSLSSRTELKGSKKCVKSSKQANILRYYSQNTSQINRIKFQTSSICKKIELIRPQNYLNQFLKSLNIEKQTQNNFTNSKKQRKNKQSFFKQSEKIQFQLSRSTNNFLNEVNQTIIRYKNLKFHKNKPKDKIIAPINPTQQPIIGWNIQENPQVINIS